MQAANHVLQTLKNGKVALGGWQMLPGTHVSRTLAHVSGLTWLLLDCEHGALTDADMHASIPIISSLGLSPLVRVPDAQHWMLKRALDAGAHGVVIPLITNVEQARDVAHWAKFPPVGSRGLGSPFSMQAFRSRNHDGAVREPSQMEYLQRANEATMVIVQIETASALQDVDAIASVPGIDVLFIGPYDLGNSIGHPILMAKMDPELLNAIEKIREAAKQAGKWSAIYANSGEQARTYVEQGFDMVNVMTDVPALARAFGEAVATATGAGR